MSTTTSIERVWLTVDESSQMTGVSKSEIYEALRSHELPGSQRGGKKGTWRIHKDDLDRWMRGGLKAIA